MIYVNLSIARSANIYIDMSNIKLLVEAFITPIIYTKKVILCKNNSPSSRTSLDL